MTCPSSRQLTEQKVKKAAKIWLTLVPAGLDLFAATSKLSCSDSFNWESLEIIYFYQTGLGGNAVAYISARK